MQEYQQRVIAEKKELDERLAKLNEFIDGPKFGSVKDDEQERMLEQSTVMRRYSEILGARIEKFQ